MLKSLSPQTFLPNIQPTSRYWPTEFWVFIFLSLTVFCVPLSSSGKSIGMAIVMVLILLTPQYRTALWQVLRQPWSLAIIGLLLLALLGCIWSPANWHEKFLVLEKYSKLGYLPVLAVGFMDHRTRQVALHAFLLAMMITAFMSIGKNFHWLQYGHGITADDPGSIFRNHIMTSYFMAFAGFIATRAILHHQGMVRGIYIGLALLYSYQLFFINSGRTGYVLYVLLLLLLIVQSFSWRQALRITFLGGILLLGCISMSAILQQKIHEATSEWQRYQQQDKDTPIGYRLQFHHYAAILFNRHPWMGNGTGSFTALYRQEKPVSAWTRALLEPHSQYWLAIAEWGRLGIVSLILLFACLLAACWRLKSMRDVAVALLLSFMIGCLSDSLLFYSGTGYFFILMMALCLGENIMEKNDYEV